MTHRELLAEINKPGRIYVEEGPEREDGFARRCAWCGSFRSEGDRRKFEEDDAPISHGICPTCLDEREEALR